MFLVGKRACFSYVKIKIKIKNDGVLTGTRNYVDLRFNVRTVWQILHRCIVCYAHNTLTLLYSEYIHIHIYIYVLYTVSRETAQRWLRFSAYWRPGARRNAFCVLFVSEKGSQRYIRRKRKQISAPRVCNHLPSTLLSSQSSLPALQREPYSPLWRNLL